MDFKQENQQTRIFVWSWPRSLSTVFAKFLSCIDDVQLWHEPYIQSFYSNAMPKVDEADNQPVTKFYLKTHHAMENLHNQPHEFSDSSLLPISLFTYPFIKSKLEEEEPGKKYIFIKDIAPAIMDHYEFLPNVPTRHTFLIRHPYRFLTSRKRLYMKNTNYQGRPEDFDMHEMSSNIQRRQYERDSMYTLWKYVQESGRDPNPIIIDAEDVSNHPEMVLPQYFAQLGIPFHVKYLTWDSSLDPIKKWKGSKEQVAINYKNGYFGRALDSCCFEGSPQPTPTREDVTPDIIKMAEFILPGYDEMYEKRVKPE